MLRYVTEGLDYFDLIRQSENRPPSPSGKTVKVAILADCATQQLASLLKALAARNGVAMDLYEGGYDSVDLEILNPDVEHFTRSTPSI